MHCAVHSLSSCVLPVITRDNFAEPVVNNQARALTISSSLSQSYAHDSPFVHDEQLLIAQLSVQYQHYHSSTDFYRDDDAPSVVNASITTVTVVHSIIDMTSPCLPIYTVKMKMMHSFHRRHSHESSAKHAHTTLFVMWKRVAMRIMVHSLNHICPHLALHIRAS